MDKEVSRYDFLQNVGRKGMLLALGGVGTAAMHGTKTVAECFDHNYCDSCFSFKGCTLPEKKEIDV
jgi:hypothetical protein